MPQPDAATTLPAALRRHSRMPLVAVLILLTAGWCAYSRVIGFDFIPFDDPGYVYENKAIQHGLTWEGVRWAFTSMTQANWHPLTWLSLMADYELYGLNPGGYHLTNFLLHEVSTILLFAWLLVATRRLWPSAGVALLFCIHPAHVESVAWVTERKDVLSTAFFVAVLLLYTLYVRTKARGYYAATLVALVLGLLAKPMLVTVPPLLLLLDAWPLGRVRNLRSLAPLLREKIPFILLAAASCVITFIAQHRQGATVSLETLPVSWRLGGAVTGYAVYIRKLFWPVDLGLFYPYWITMPAARTTACVVGLLLATGGAFWTWRQRPYLLVGWLWFLGTMVPVIGLVQVGNQALADRYTYQPYIGLFMILSWGMADLWQRLPRLRPALAIGSAVALAGCLALCYRQVGYWQDGTLIFERTLAVTRPNVRSYIALGDAYIRQHRYAQAEAAYHQAFKIEPSNPTPVIKLGYLTLEQGRWDLAYQWLRQIAIPGPCIDPVIFNNFGFTLIRLGRLEEACTTLRYSIQLRSDYSFAHSNLADALRNQGKNEAAAAEYETALSLNPEAPSDLAQLAWLYSNTDTHPTAQQTASALALASRAVALTSGKNVLCLDALAAAQAASNAWREAEVTAQSALSAAQALPGATADYIALRLERLNSYRAGQRPAR